MTSRFGRPTDDELLDDTEGNAQVAVVQDNNERDDDDDDDDDGDDGWGDLTVNLTAASKTVKRPSSCGLFVPEQANVLDSSSSKPAMPLLDQHQLPPGSVVWVVDEDDVQMLLKDFWDHAIRVVCNGRVQGNVVKHSGESLTVVQFADPKGRIKFSFTLPRQCLSLEKIEPYDHVTLKKRGSLGHSIGGVGNLGPRAGRGTAKTKEEIHYLQQYYEVISANKIVEEFLDPIVDLIDKGKFVKALEGLEKLVLDPAVAHQRKELLCARSTLNIFSGNVSAALNDALDVIQINPSWVKGYLRAARAHSAAGKFILANQMINQTLLLLPHCPDIAVVSDLNDYLITLQTELKNDATSFRLDALYIKQLFPKRAFRAGEVMLEEHNPIVCVPSLYTKEPHCTTCLSRHATTLASPTRDKRGMLYCSEACQKKSALFVPSEVDTFGQGYKSAITLIQNKAASSLNLLPLEIARLTIRLFFIVYSTHQAASSGKAATPIEVVLKDLGVYPLVTNVLDNKTRDELTVLYSVLTGIFSPADKLAYPDKLFLNLFVYVSTYIVCAPVLNTKHFTGAEVAGFTIAQQQQVVGYFVPRFVGGVERAAAAAATASVDEVNCVIRCNSSGHLALVAEADVHKEGKLVMRPLKAQR